MRVNRLTLKLADAGQLHGVTRREDRQPQQQAKFAPKICGVPQPRPPFVGSPSAGGSEAGSRSNTREAV